MMRRGIFKNVALPAAIVIACLGTSALLSGSLERSKPELPAGHEDADLAFNGSRLRGFALGMEGLIADWYWMRALQYIGDKLLKAESDTVDLEDLRALNPRLLYPYLENATDLDPHFLAAYSYGALVMPAIDAEKAIAIARKGIANNPDQWRFYQHLGYIYWRLGRYDDAAGAFETGSNIPGALPFMKLMAGSMRTEGGSRGTAREVFTQMLDGSNDPSVKLTAERRIAELDSLDERDAIDGVLNEFRERYGRCASGFSEILPRLATVNLPGGREFRIDKARNLVDPTGVPYLLDQQNCKALIDGAKSGIPVK
jgi:tetratricopeptide (TPR) repeat protein